MPDLRVVWAFEVWVNLIGKPAVLKSLRISLCVLFAAALMQPDRAVADHAPDSLSQDADPNYIACLMSVDDAKPQFLDALQATCLTRMIEICSGLDNEAPQSQVIQCISFEMRRGTIFCWQPKPNFLTPLGRQGYSGAAIKGDAIAL